ncbi:MAG: hypothetical protein QME81_18405 [bacterium]|nr:hypothetical protein [bacterium]
MYKQTEEGLGAIEMTAVKANIFQINLIRESGLKPIIWITRYARRFRDLVNSGVEEYDQLKNLIYI